MNEDIKGLTSEEAKKRLNLFGPNKLIEKKKRTALSILVSQFKNPLIYIITVAALISIILKKYDDAIIIGIVIIIDAIVGSYQEYRAEATMNALKGLLKPVAHVMRDNIIREIEVSEIVPGDCVIINSGDKIPADGELIESISLGLNEAILTGESENIIKNINDKVFMGTSVVSGRGKMHVVSTGTKTELGKIAESLSDIKNETTPLQIRLEKFGKSLTLMVIFISFIIMALGLILKYNILEMIELSVVLAIAAIPEGLLIAVTMILVIGMRSILKQKVWSKNCWQLKL
jgi:Ca2+-transporting ATPase